MFYAWQLHLLPHVLLQLFNFDSEVQPVLEVLVGKTIEQSLLEVLEEEELACLRAQQRAYQELRNIELAEVQRLQEQERRHSEERVCKNHRNKALGALVACLRARTTQRVQSGLGPNLLQALAKR